MMWVADAAGGLGGHLLLALVAVHGHVHLTGGGGRIRPLASIGVFHGIVMAVVTEVLRYWSWLRLRLRRWRLEVVEVIGVI